MIVADASAVADLLLSTSRGAEVARALAGEVEIQAPDLLQPEVMAVVRRWLTRGWIDGHSADRAVAELGELPVVAHAHAPLRERVWQLRHGVTAYDAHYVALAEALDAELLTTDQRLARTAGTEVRVVFLGGASP